MIKLFSWEALRTGWSVWWRAWLPFALGMAVLLAGAIILPRILPQTGTTDTTSYGILALLFPFLLVLGLTVGLVFWLDGASKKVAVTRYHLTISQFVGWKVFWRTWLMTAALGIPTVVILIILGALLTPAGVSAKTGELILMLLELIGIALRFLFLILACGWAFGRVLKTSQPTNPAS